MAVPFTYVYTDARYDRSVTDTALGYKGLWKIFTLLGLKYPDSTCFGTYFKISSDIFQTSPESPAIFILLQKIFKSQPISELKRIALEKGLTEDEFQVNVD